MSEPPVVRVFRPVGLNASLPNGDYAEVHDDKIIKYLLNEKSAEGAPKRKFLLGFGFTSDDPQVLKEAMERHAATRTIVEEHQSEWGTKYVIECKLLSPDGRHPCVRTVWIKDAGEGSGPPRFVTLVPNPKGRRHPAR